MQYKAGVIGLGKIGLTYDFDPKREKPSSHTLAYLLNPDILFSGAVDTNSLQEKLLSGLAPEAKFYRTVAALMLQEKCDIVSICTPPGNHLQVIKEIFAVCSPKVVFCEKPLAENSEVALQIKKIIQEKNCIVIPNFSRRFNSGMRRVKDNIQSGRLGNVQKVHIRYTRGVFNTGSHLFDLLNWWGIKIETVRVISRTGTSGEKEGDPSFSFTFRSNQAEGYAEAFNDEQYYLFEIDIYLSQGKIEIKNSGNDVAYYQVGDHPLFTGFKSLRQEWAEQQLLADSNLANAMKHIVGVLQGTENPVCTVEDGIYPLVAAEGLMKSFKNGGSLEKLLP